MPCHALTGCLCTALSVRRTWLHARWNAVLGTEEQNGVEKHGGFSRDTIKAYRPSVAHTDTQPTLPWPPPNQRLMHACGAMRVHMDQPIQSPLLAQVEMQHLHNLVSPPAVS